MLSVWMAFGTSIYTLTVMVLPIGEYIKPVGLGWSTTGGDFSSFGFDGGLGCAVRPRKSGKARMAVSLMD